MPVFSNPVGFYALLGIPAVLVIHFLQHRSRKVTTSTLFLIDALAPESRTGRVWSRIRNSLALWMQIACVLLLTWVLVQPRWLLADTWQTVVFVMDDSLRMQAFRTEAIEAVRRDMEVIDSTRIPTHWVIMTSSSRKAPLYRGDNRALALDSLSGWIPAQGEHDPVAALRTAQTVVADYGVSRFVTFSPSRVPPWQSAVGVGHVIDNVGFVGLIPDDQASGGGWRVAIKNHAPSVQLRRLELVFGETSTTQDIELNADSVAEIRVALPPGVDSVELKLNEDGFAKDDILPVMRERPKTLAVSIDADEKTLSFMEKLVRSIPGGGVSTGSAPNLHIVVADDTDHLPPGPSIVLARKAGKNDTGMVTPESHHLTRDLSWGGLLISGRGTFEAGPASQVLLWCDGKPLAWLQRQALVLNWSWSESNADRLASAVLLLRRFMEDVQAGTVTYASGNVATGSKFPVPGAAWMRFTPLSGESVQQAYRGTTPDAPGWVEIARERDMQEVLFRGAVYPSDARQGDFSSCATFEHRGLGQERIVERISTPDPLVALWLALAATALLVSWIPGKQERRGDPS